MIDDVLIVSPFIAKEEHFVVGRETVFSVPRTDCGLQWRLII